MIWVGWHFQLSQIFPILIGWTPGLIIKGRMSTGGRQFIYWLTRNELLSCYFGIAVLFWSVYFGGNRPLVLSLYYISDVFLLPLAHPHHLSVTTLFRPSSIHLSTWLVLRGLWKPPFRNDDNDIHISVWESGRSCLINISKIIMIFTAHEWRCWWGRDDRTTLYWLI